MRTFERIPEPVVRALLPTAVVCALVVAPSGLRAQAGTSADGDAEPVATITAEDLERHVGVLAADSMEGRNTPSPGLRATAEYVAGQFRSFGLRPALGESYQQWYPLTIIRPSAPESQQLVFTRDGETLRLEAGSDFASLGAGSDQEARGEIRRVDPSADPGSAEGEVLILEASASDLGSTLASVRKTVGATGASAAVVLVELPPERFSQIGRFLSRERIQLGEPEPLETPVVIVRKAALPEGLRRSLGSASGATGWSARVRSGARLEPARAMNTIGWIEGSDPGLRDEYVIFTAHMDHVGVDDPVDGDSIYNGADDNGSGTATILELAEAFARAEEAPRRSVVFMTVSGEEKGLLGSQWYTEHPVFPLNRTVANVNIDMIGRNWRDTVVAIGQDHSTLGGTIQAVAAEHPELGMAVVEDRWPDQRFYFRSDHFNFARRGVPALFLFSGIHEDYHRPSDEVEHVRFEKTARIGRLLYHLGREVADADGRPEWDADSYRQIVEGSGG